MEYGFHMSTRGATAEPDAIVAVARHSEQLGFTYFGVNDHVVVATGIDSAYPYTEDGSWAGAAEGICLETLTTMAFVAGATERMRLLSSVLVLPHRPPVLAAKMLATVDVLSKGRLTVGVGVGWMREEMQALGAPDYARRGTVSGEYMEAFRVLWREDVANYHGEYVQFDNVVFAPKPVQSGGPPLWVGGEGAAARERAARYGDGWYPVGRNPRYRLDRVDRFAAGLADVHARAERAGRDPASLAVGMFAPWNRVGREVLDAGERLPFTGSPDAIVDDIGRFEEAGLGALMVNLEGRTVEETMERCEQFALAVGLVAPA